MIYPLACISALVLLAYRAAAPLLSNAKVVMCLMPFCQSLVLFQSIAAISVISFCADRKSYAAHEDATA